MNFKRILAAVCVTALLFTACTAPQSQSVVAKEDTPQAPAETNALQVVMKLYMQNCDNENGFYHVETPDTTHQNLMYYDYKTLQQRYVCDATDCKHDQVTCTSYMDSTGGVYPFVFKEKLYLFYIRYNDGTADPNQWPSALEQRNLDGTGAQLMAKSTDGTLYTNGTILADEKALYWTAYVGNSTVMMRFSPEDKALTTVGQMDQIVIPLEETWNGKQLGILYGEHNDPAKGAQLCTISVQDASVKILHTWVADTFSLMAQQLFDGKLLHANLQTGEIMAYDLASDTDTVLTDAFAKYATSSEATAFGETWINYGASVWAADIIDDWLFASGNFNLENPEEYIRKGYNMKTGEMKDITLGDFFNGYIHPLWIQAQTDQGLLVVEEHRARTVNTTGPDGAPYTFESDFSVYAFLDTEDYINSKPNFREIAPVEYAGAN